MTDLIDGKYQVENAVGSGAFGTVFKAWQPALNRHVALKMLNVSTSQDSVDVRRFEVEAKALSAIKHKNIVSFYGFGVYDRSYYIAMELVEGEALDKIIGAKPMEMSRAIDVAGQALEGLEAAHAANIVHRDLKTSNLLLSGSGPNLIVKVIDFGLVKLMPGFGLSGQKLTETGMAIGTCKYMSPEQCTGQAEVDRRSDLYSMGCILFEMLTGNSPFEAADPVSMMVAHVNDPLPSLVNYFGPDAQNLDRVMQKATSKDPDDRFQTASAFREALLEAASLVPSGELKRNSAVPPSSKTTHRIVPKKSARGRSKWLLLAGVCAGLMVIAGVYSLSPRPKVLTPLETKSAAVQPLEPELDVSALDFREMPLKDLQAHRERFDRSLEIGLLKEFYVQLTTKEAAVGQWAEAIQDLRRINVHLYKAERNQESLINRVMIGDCGISGHLPDSDWLPDVTEGIQIADRLNEAQFAGRLRVLLWKTLRRQGKNAEAVETIEKAIANERDSIATGEKMIVLTRGEPELEFADYCFDAKDTKGAAKWTAAALQQMKTGSPDGLTVPQTYMLSAFCQKNAASMPSNAVTLALELLKQSNSDLEDPRWAGDTEAAKKALQQELKARKK